MSEITKGKRKGETVKVQGMSRVEYQCGANSKTWRKETRMPFRRREISNRIYGKCRRERRKRKSTSHRGRVGNGSLRLFKVVEH